MSEAKDLIVLQEEQGRTARETMMFPECFHREVLRVWRKYTDD